jgi:RimJ/RimL family protein N-acetyltransferase
VTGHRRLSEETVRRRFLTAKPRLSSTELRYLTEVDGADHVALIAVPVEHPDAIVAVGRFVRDRDDPEMAEFAIVVGDPYQGRGLGTELARLLVDEALAHGVHRFTATMLSDNVPIRRLIEHMSQRLTFEPASGGVSQVFADLAA